MPFQHREITEREQELITACGKLIEVGNIVREFAGEINVSLYLTLLEIGQRHYQSVTAPTSKELIEATGYSQSTISRNIAILSDIGTKERPGYGLIRIEHDPQDRRRQILCLSDKGIDLCVKLAATIR